MKKKGLIVLIVVSAIAVLCSFIGFLETQRGSVSFKRCENFNDSTPRHLPDTDKLFEEYDAEEEDKVLDNKNYARETIFSNGRNYIAQLFIEGTITTETKIYNQKYFLDTIDNLIGDKRNSGIILFLDTPGGSIYETDELYLKLEEYKRITNRPVYAYMASMACSGGYYLACAAEKIVANRNALTGSIGVIAGQSFDATELLDKIGVKSITIHSGKNKNMMNFNEPFNKEQQEIMQSLADEAYEQFVEIIKNSRNMPIDKVYNIADGRVYSAKQALSNGLIDEISDRRTALEQFQIMAARELAGKKAALPKIIDYRYASGFDIRDIFNDVSGLKKAFARPIELKAVIE